MFTSRPIKDSNDIKSPRIYQSDDSVVQQFNIKPRVSFHARLGLVQPGNICHNKPVILNRPCTFKLLLITIPVKPFLMERTLIFWEHL